MYFHCCFHGIILKTQIVLENSGLPLCNLVLALRDKKTGEDMRWFICRPSPGGTWARVFVFGWKGNKMNLWYANEPLSWVLVSTVYSKMGNNQACDTSSSVCLAPSVMNHINLLKLTRINCLSKATWHWNDILPQQLGIWPLINLICLLVYFCLSLFLTDVCPITASTEGSARKRGTASNAPARRPATAGPPATTVSANLSHFNLVIVRESQVFSHALKLSSLNYLHAASLDLKSPDSVVITPKK